MINLLILVVSLGGAFYFQKSITGILYGLCIALFIILLRHRFYNRNNLKKKLLDMSALVDGRIVDLCELRFVTGVVLIPKMIVSKLKKLENSKDIIERGKAKKALDVIVRLKKTKNVVVQLVSQDYKGLDEKNTIIKIAKNYDAQLVTLDFNIMRLARARRISLLDLYELSNIVRTIAVPGDRMRVYVIKQGRGYNEALSFLEDGTMVVIDNGKSFVGKKVEILVTAVKAHSYKRTIFSKLIGPMEN